MTVCDICSKPAKIEEGFALTTSQVVETPAYWAWMLEQHALDDNMLLLYTLSPIKTLPLAAGINKGCSGHDIRYPGACPRVVHVQQQARQASGWLVCVDCSDWFEFDHGQARRFAREKLNPEDSGPADVNRTTAAAAKAWHDKYEECPSWLKA